MLLFFERLFPYTKENIMKQDIVKAFWPSFSKHRTSWMIALAALVVVTGLHTIFPYFIRGIVDTFTSDAPDVLLAKSLFAGLILVLIGINIGYRILGSALILHESRTMRDLDSKSFWHIQRQSIRFFEDTHSGALVTQARRFRSSYQTITDLFFFSFGPNIMMLIAITIAFIHALPALALPFLAWTALFIAYCTATSIWKYPFDEAVAERDSDVGAALADSVFNHPVVKTYGQEKSEQHRFDGIVQTSHKTRLRSWIRSEVISLGQWTLMGTGQMAFLWWMIVGWERGSVTAGDFVFVQSFLVWASSSLSGFGQDLRWLFTAIADAKEMASVYRTTPEVQDAPGARPLIVDQGEIEFHSIHFTYDSGPPAIDDFSLTIPSGRSVGLVGTSGAGKSTLVKLLLRFYELDSGYIRIDRQDIANVTQVSLRQQVAVVPQHAQLFHRTIRENIAFAQPDPNESEILDAARQAHAWEFISEFPNGLDTIVGERGVKLSGGQQQRIVIARAILADPRILVLDEATSALDSVTERLIQKAIANLLRNRTAIVIAHRLSTIMRLDHIVVMEHGRIVENGSHKELLEYGGTYANLWRHQVGGYIG